MTLTNLCILCTLLEQKYLFHLTGLNWEGYILWNYQLLPKSFQLHFIFELGWLSGTRPLGPFTHSLSEESPISSTKLHVIFKAVPQSMGKMENGPISPLNFQRVIASVHFSLKLTMLESVSHLWKAILKFLINHLMLHKSRA